MKVYISGRIKDTPNYLANFQRGCDSMTDAGHDPVDPCKLCHQADATYEDFMREDIRALLDCDAIFMLAGWERSGGARLEHTIACQTGLRLWYEDSPYTELSA